MLEAPVAAPVAHAPSLRGYQVELQREGDLALEEVPAAGFFSMPTLVLARPSPRCLLPASCGGRPDRGLVFHTPGVRFASCITDQFGRH